METKEVEVLRGFDITAHMNEVATYEAVEITPDMATAALELNYDKQRQLKNAYLERYTRAMKAGRWRLNGESIKFSKTGRVIDGQHRLYACIAAGVSFIADIRYGLEEDVYDTINTGAIRLTNDFLHGQKEADPRYLATALNWLWRIETHVVNVKAARPSPDEAMDYLDQHSTLRESLQAVKKARHLVSAPLAAALHYQFKHRDTGRTEEFFQRIADGAALLPGDPIYHLRERLITNRAAKNKMQGEEVCALIIKTWNAYFQGRPVKVIKWSEAEQFPEIL